MRSVAIALEVLEAVSEHQPVGVSDLARSLELPKTTIHRTLATLNELGWIRADPGSRPKWMLTSKAAAIGSRVAPERDMRAAVREVMQQLTDETGETVHFSVPDGRHVVLVEKIESTNAVRTVSTVGQRLPAHATSAGQAMLAALPDADVVELLGATPLEPLTPHSITGLQDLLRELATVRKRGYAQVIRARHVDVSAVGAAVLDAAGRPVGALSISIPAHRFPEERWSEFGRLVADAAAAAGAQG